MEEMLRDSILVKMHSDGDDLLNTINKVKQHMNKTYWVVVNPHHYKVLKDMKLKCKVIADSSILENTIYILYNTEDQDDYMNCGYTMLYLDLVRCSEVRMEDVDYLIVKQSN